LTKVPNPECDDSSDELAKSTYIELQLGAILGSEEACGLIFDEDAVKNFIIDQIKDDPRFADSLQTTAEYNARQNEKMSKGILAAHCILVRRFAKANGFIK
jgi:hypothetical protein